MSNYWPIELDTGDRLVPESVFADTKALPHFAYQRDPIGWMRDKMGVPEWQLRWSLGYPPDYVWDGSPDPLANLCDTLAWWDTQNCRAIGVESGTSTGKSYLMALLILWFLACFPNAEVYTFAPKEDQLALYIWKNISGLWDKFSRHFPLARLGADLTIWMTGKSGSPWFAVGYAIGMSANEQVSVKASGMHAEHMLLIYEEGTAIDPRVYAAGKFTCTAPHNIRVAVGNPNYMLDPLHKFCVEPGTKHIIISALDHPNVVLDDPGLIPGAQSKENVERLLEEFGPNDPTYLARVRGRSPEQSANALIRREWIQRSNIRWLARKARGDVPTLVTAKGVDAANSEHGDEACIVDFSGNMTIRHEARPCPDSNQLGREVYAEMKDPFARMGGPPLNPLHVGVDGVGVGAGTVNELHYLKQMVQAINFGDGPVDRAQKAPDGHKYDWVPDSNQHRNLRSQVYWQVREDLRRDVIDLMPDPELEEELLAHQFDEDRDLKFYELHPKMDVKKAIGRSPNKSDALAIANWVRPRKTDAEDEAPAVKQAGVSMGYDHTNHRPRRGGNPQDELAKLFAANVRDPLTGRPGKPYTEDGRGRQNR